MVTLRESIDISAYLEEVYDWLLHLDENFTKWNPKHNSFEMLSGGLDVGDTVRFSETVQGISYNIEGTIRKNEKDDKGFQIMFETKAGLGRIWFIGERTDFGCWFTHKEEFGRPDTFFGRIINWLLFEVIAKKRANWELIREDMEEDNECLKRILEARDDSGTRSCL
jgi:hypothetical protein